MSEPSAPDRVNLLVVTPEQVLFDGAAHWVQIPLCDGLLGVWPGHAPLIASLAAGELMISTDQGLQSIAVPGGILRIDVERCVVLAGGLSEGFRASRPEAIEITSTDREQLVADMEEALREALSEEELEELQAG
ncbi:MAG: hypothetical protein H5T69_06085 [Chloroflexi bacterium]|nr:hypothetical protein [Chloroflexota bacterium]